MKYVCPDCEEKLVKINGITNLHLTGDAKNMFLYHCNKCSEKFLIVSMVATVGSGDNYFKFRIGLTENEAKEIEEKMNECPEPHNEDCTCPAHDFLDEFDKQNKDRRVILQDEYDRWV